MKDPKGKFEQLLEILTRAMDKYAAQHARPSDFGTGVELHRAEIHTLQAIGDHEGINVTQLAEKMGVTKGAASQMIAKLARKGLIEKNHAGDNAKEIHLALTARGTVAHKHHSDLHRAMYDLVRKHFGPRFEMKMDRFIEVMTDLDEIMKLFERQEEKFHGKGK